MTGIDLYGDSVARRVSAGELQAQGEATEAQRARRLWLERVAEAAKRVAVAWPYYRELTDYVEFEVAMADLRDLLGLPAED